MNNLLENADLRVFVTVARQGSFAGAAQALGMSAAYVSKRIGVLEAALGVRLFQRTTRRVVITGEGEQVYARALAILDQLDELLAIEPEQVAAGARPVVDVVLLDNMGPDEAREAVAAIRSARRRSASTAAAAAAAAWCLDEIAAANREAKL